jgi:hypothetical protein
VLLFLAAAMLPPGAPAADRKPAPHALVAGTVFRDPGFALPGAEVWIERLPLPAGSPVKLARWRAVSDARGEFAVRVPPEPASYRVTVSAKGFRGESRQVDVTGEQRFEVTFNLQPESKP